MKVYAVIEVNNNILTISGMYKTLVYARDHAADIAGYGGYEPMNDDAWGEYEDGVFVKAYDVL